MSRRLGAARPDPGREPTIPTRPSIAPLAVVHCLGASKTVTGAKFLVEKQSANGQWEHGGDWNKPVWNTCFAILFLKRATRPLVVSTDRR